MVIEEIVQLNVAQSSCIVYLGKTCVNLLCLFLILSSVMLGKSGNNLLSIFAGGVL